MQKIPRPGSMKMQVKLWVRQKNLSIVNRIPESAIIQITNFIAWTYAMTPSTDRPA
ncbi:MAG: hypothetical protein WBZ29_04485 [Methanocella sp.]